MERQRVIIGFTTNELRLLTKLAHKSKVKADEIIENGISRWSHKAFLKHTHEQGVSHDGRVPFDKSDYNIAKEAIEKRADRKFGVSNWHKNGKHKARKSNYRENLLLEARKECEEQYLEDHPSLKARMDLYKKLDTVLDQIRYPSLQDDEWRKTRVIIQA